VSDEAVRDDEDVEPGLTTGLDFEVTADDTARALLSGDLEVLATPRLVAWLEAATCAAVREALDPGQTTVGTKVGVEHRAASPIGATVRTTATLTMVEGRMLTFAVTALDADSGQVLGDGTIVRAIVDRERFLGSLGARTDRGPGDS
jgi:fluoroacetyl-CoA thioesterase